PAAMHFPLNPKSPLWPTHYPTLLVFLLLALAAYLASRRVRYYGNTTPLLVIVLLWLLAVAGLAPDTLAYGAIPLRALPFIFLFLGGVAADMLETRRRDIVTGMIAALLLSNSLIGLLDLRRAGGAGHPFQVEERNDQ